MNGKGGGRGSAMRRPCQKSRLREGGGTFCGLVRQRQRVANACDKEKWTDRHSLDVSGCLKKIIKDWCPYRLAQPGKNRDGRQSGEREEVDFLQVFTPLRLWERSHKNPTQANTKNKQQKHNTQKTKQNPKKKKLKQPIRRLPKQKKLV